MTPATSQVPGTSMATAIPTADSESVPRDAIVYLPGLLEEGGVQRADAIARRLATALDQSARTGEATFAVLEGREESFTASCSTRVATIVRTDASGTHPIIDVYDYPYVPSLTARFRRRNPVVQALGILAFLVAHARTIVTATFTARSKDRSQRLQVLYGAGVFSLLLVYMLLLLGGALASGADAVRRVAGDTTPPAGVSPVASPAPASGDVPPEGGTETVPTWLYWWRTAIVFGVAAGLLSRTSLKDILARVATETACAGQYLAFGARGNVVAGELAALLEHIHEKRNDGVRYRAVHVVAFSFGSVVALDALFPSDEPGERFREIDALVTVGCPFDFVRTYWPSYFRSRRAHAAVPRRWINVYACADVLGSDFRDEGPDGLTQAGIELGAGEIRRPRDEDQIVFGPAQPLGDYGLGQWLTFVGFRVHSAYWDRDSDEGVTCFRSVVRKLYGADAYVLT